MNYRFFFLILFGVTAHLLTAQTSRWSLDSKVSNIHYEAEHLLHKWDGKNQQVKGLLLQDAEKQRFEKIAILCQVRDFDSNNSNRDAHALEVLEVLKYPDIKFYSEQITQNADSLKLEGSFEFHGKSVEKTVICAINKSESGVTLSGEFNLVLTDFGVKLPAFMMVKIADLVTIDFQLVFQKAPLSK